MTPRGSVCTKLVLLVLLAAGPAAPALADLPEVQQRGTLRVLVVDTLPEFFAIRAAAAPGFDREVLEGFARLQKVQLEVVEVPTWSVLVQWLLEGKGDLIAGVVTATESRRKQIDFTVEVFPSRNVVITRKPGRVVTTVEQLREERVGTTRATRLAEMVAQLRVPAANIDDTLPPGSFGRALREGNITAAVVGLEEAILAQRKDSDIQVGFFVGPIDSLAYGVRKEDPLLVEALNAYIANVRRSGAWNRLVVKYFGERALDVVKQVQTP